MTARTDYVRACCCCGLGGQGIPDGGAIRVLNRHASPCNLFVARRFAAAVSCSPSQAHRVKSDCRGSPQPMAAAMPTTPRNSGSRAGKLP